MHRSNLGKWTNILLALGSLTSFVNAVPVQSNADNVYTQLNPRRLLAVLPPDTSPNLAHRTLNVVDKNDKAAIRAEIERVVNLEETINFCPSHARDTSFIESFKHRKDFAFAFAPNYGLTGCSIMIVFNKQSFYIGHYYERRIGESTSVRLQNIKRFLKQGNPKEKENVAGDGEEEEMKDLGPFPPLLSRAELKASGFSSANDPAEVYIIVLSKGPKTATEDQSVITAKKNRVAALIDATVGPQKCFNDRLPSCGPQEKNTGAFPNAHAKVTHYYPSANDKVVEFALQYDAETNQIRAMIGDKDAKVVFHRDLDKPWDERTDGPSTATSAVAVEHTKIDQCCENPNRKDDTSGDSSSNPSDPEDAGGDTRMGGT